jgi:mRNA-degrading endonuclease RelE of RelBE toxin-antitoxin system
VKKTFELIYDPEVRSHLSKIELKYHLLIRQAIKKSLTHQPGVETLNRKPLLRPSILETAWELRFGINNRFRVFYKINEEAHAVYILAYLFSQMKLSTGRIF